MCVIELLGAQTTDIHKTGKSKRSKFLHSFSFDEAIHVEAISEDPKSEDFMGFRIVKTKKHNKTSELSRFRADNIVHMRNFMASLGGIGTGLFSSKGADGNVTIESTKGKWDNDDIPEEVDGEEVEVFIQQISGVMATADVVFALPSNGNIKAYEDALSQLPMAFYYNFFVGITLSGDLAKERRFPGYPFPVYDVDSPLSKNKRRPESDTIWDPRNPIPRPCYLYSLGYGAEVGLFNGMQEVFDPCLKQSIFLDHNGRQVILHDPRPQKQWYPPVQHQTCNMGDTIARNMPPEVDDVKPTVIRRAAERARSLPIGFTLFARGQSGRPGADGTQGISGADGKHGKSGAIFFGSNDACGGHRGQDGGNGGKGERGMNANRGGDVMIILNGTPEQLDISGSVTSRAYLGGVHCEHILLVDCHGGDGGKGGAGGRGGDGGKGGCGGNGTDSSVTDQDGGDGGDGGNGGDGGRGGNAGDGGDAGSGGKCLVQASDPRLLILVEADCTPGRPGDGAPGGKGGSGGNGGNGGSGGHGGPGHKYHYIENNVLYKRYTPGGNRGARGRGGYAGRSGASGRGSRKGQEGQCGGMLWVVWSPLDSRIIQQSNTRYDAKVTCLYVVPARNSGIFEPNERITVSGIVVHNTGGLDLPFGATAFIPNSEGIIFEPARFEIPQGAVNSGKTYTIPFEFHGRIKDEPPPTQPVKMLKTTTFHPRIEILGRPFHNSFYIQQLTVQYPVEISMLYRPENMGRGEIAIIAVEVSNVSRIPYGNCKMSGGKVVLQLHFDSRIIPLGVAEGKDDILSYAITYDANIRDSMFVEVLELQPNSKVTIKIKIQMESRAELFDRCKWQADLFLREKLIEYKITEIRVSPVYCSQKPAGDVLLVTSEAISRQEFVLWQHILELLKVSVDFWDTTRYHGMSLDSRTNARHKNSWQGRYEGKMILYPHCNLRLLYGIDIAKHFHGDDYSSQTLSEVGSSLIAFMPEAPHGTTEHDSKVILRHLAFGGKQVEIRENSYGGKHLTKPNPTKVPQFYAKWEKKFIKKHEKINPFQVPVLFSRNLSIQSTGLFKYLYGQVDFREVPLLKSSKFLEIDGIGGNMVAMSLDDAHLSTSSNDIPLASKYGQVFLATLYGIPLSSKLSLIKNDTKSEGEYPQGDLVFYLPNKKVISTEELSMITLAWEIADEVFSFTAEVNRMQDVYEDINSDTQAYIKNAEVVLRGMKLIKKELNKRKSRVKHSKVSKACNGISAIVDKTQRLLLRAGADNSKLEKMMSLEFLQDRSRVHRSHQHYVKDKLWNLVD